MSTTLLNTVIPFIPGASCPFGPSELQLPAPYSSLLEHHDSQQLKLWYGLITTPHSLLARNGFRVYACVRLLFATYLVGTLLTLHRHKIYYTTRDNTLPHLQTTIDEAQHLQDCIPCHCKHAPKRNGLALIQPGCCHINYTIGLVFNPQSSVGLPSQRYYYPQPFRYPRRGAVLLCHTDLQYVAALPAIQQAYVSSNIHTN